MFNPRLFPVSVFFSWYFLLSDCWLSRSHPAFFPSLSLALVLTCSLVLPSCVKRKQQHIRGVLVSSVPSVHPLMSASAGSHCFTHFTSTHTHTHTHTKNRMILSQKHAHLSLGLSLSRSLSLLLYHAYKLYYPARTTVFHLGLSIFDLCLNFANL